MKFTFEALIGLPIFAFDPLDSRLMNWTVYGGEFGWGGTFNK